VATTSSDFQSTSEWKPGSEDYKVSLCHYSLPLKERKRKGSITIRAQFTKLV
jgi:hypothetical protein